MVNKICVFVALAGVLLSAPRYSFAESPVITLPRKLGKVLESKRRFDGQGVACRKKGKHFIQPGQLGLVDGEYSWASLQERAESLARAGNLIKANRYSASVDRLTEVCQKTWTKYLRPEVTSRELTVLKKRSVQFELEAQGPGKISFKVTEKPRKGRLTRSGLQFTYTPKRGFTGKDVLKFVARANGLESRQARITFRVKDCSFRSNDLVLDSPEGQDIVSALPIQDTCYPEIELTPRFIQSPNHGTVSFKEGQFTYRPHHHSVQSDLFILEATSHEGMVRNAQVQINYQTVNSDFAGNPNLLGRYRENLSEAEVKSVLDRVAFGGTPQQRSIRTLTALVDSLLDTPENPRLQELYEETTEERLQGSLSADTSYNPRWFDSHVWIMAMNHLLFGNGFQNWMAFGFWHNHFTVNLRPWSNSGDNHRMPEHILRLHRNALGNFRDFVEDMLTDLTFHQNLDNFGNTVAEENENFGREFLELFTAGVKDPIRKDNNYDEMDVVTSTRALSGYYWVTGTTAHGVRRVVSGLPAPRNFEATYSRQVWNPLTQSFEYANDIQLTWPGINAASARFYVIERAPLNIESWTPVRSIPYSYTPYVHFSYDSANGLPQVVFRYRLRLQDVSGTMGPPSNVAYGMFGEPAPSLSAPASISASTLSGTPEIRLSWSSVSGATGYRVMRRSYDSGWWYAVSPLLSGSTTNFVDTLVAPNQVYAYQVRTMDSSGRLSEIDRSDTAVHGVDFAHGYYYEPEGSAAPPSRIVASEQQTDGVLLTWERSPDASAYRIYRGILDREAFEPIATVAGDQTSYLDTSIPPGITHEYSIWPIDSRGLISRPASASFEPSRWNTSADNLSSHSFLVGIPADHPNAVAKIQQPGVPMSGRGWSFKGTTPVLSFSDHVVMNWPATRRTIGAKLFASIAHRSLNEDIVHGMAELLLANDFDLKSTLRTVLSSSAMFAPQAHNTCIKSPLENLITLIRRANLPAESDDTRYRYYIRLVASGYRVFDPPSVFGWRNCGLVRDGLIEDGTQWTESMQTYIGTGNAISGIMFDAAIPTSAGNPGEGLNLLAHFVPEGASAQPAVVVDRIAAQLGVTINTEQRTLLIQYLNTNNLNQFSAFNGATHRDRVTGLVRILAMSDSFLTK